MMTVLRSQRQCPMCLPKQWATTRDCPYVPPTNAKPQITQKENQRLIGILHIYPKVVYTFGNLIAQEFSFFLITKTRNAKSTKIICVNLRIIKKNIRRLRRLTQINTDIIIIHPCKSVCIRLQESVNYKMKDALFFYSGQPASDSYRIYTQHCHKLNFPNAQKELIFKS